MCSDLESRVMVKVQCLITSLYEILVKCKYFLLFGQLLPKESLREGLCSDYEQSSFFFTFILFSSITTKRVFLGKGVSSGLEPVFWVRCQGHMDPCVKSQHIAQSLHDTVRITFYPGSVRVNILCSNLEPTFLCQRSRTYQVIFV